MLLIGLLFVLLAADVRLDDVQSLGWKGIAVVGALVLVVRPIVVWLSTTQSDLSVRERLLISWLAPRGIIAAAVASVTAAALDGAGSIGPFPIIRSQVFMVSILASAVSFQAFRERAYRYAASKALAWVTLEQIDARGRDDD